MKIKKIVCCLFSFCCVALLAGCASSQMKGTPFYTGEYGVRRGNVEDRVNLWPALYYREPALSVLWPFIEKTEDHFAVRPVMSVYGLNRSSRVYNVFWPLGRFDSRRKDYRFFPVFWGEKRMTVFPLYWHRGRDSKEEIFYDGLLPLWFVCRRGNDWNVHAFYPVFNWKDMPCGEGWRVWPLIGRYRTPRRNQTYFLWPLGHHWSGRNSEDTGTVVFPVFARRRQANKAEFYSLPWSMGTRPDGEEWQCAFPLYYRSKGPDDRKLYSPLYFSSRDADGDGWSLVPPLYYQSEDGESKTFASLLGGCRTEGNRQSFLFVPLLSWGTADTEAGSGSWWAGGPFMHHAWTDDGSKHHFLPFYYWSKTPDQRAFISPLWSDVRRKDGSNWQLLPPLMFKSSDSEGRILMTPLYSSATDRQGQIRWQSILPLIYRSRSEDGYYAATLLGSIKKQSNKFEWFVFPLLSGGRSSPVEKEMWLLGPVAHKMTTKSESSSHVFPFYYHNTDGNIFASPLYASWDTEKKQTRLIPPLLSWKTGSADRQDLWIAGPLAHFSWGKNGGPDHIFPLYYSNPRKHRLISPLFARWNTGQETNWLFPPLLSHYGSDGSQRELNLLLGLYHQKMGTEEDNSHLLPVYMWKEDEHFYTPLFGWNTTADDGFFYPLTPLAGAFTGERSGGWLFPLFSLCRDKQTDNFEGSFLWGRYRSRGRKFSSGLFPLFRYKRSGKDGRGNSDRSFWCFPICWYKSGSKCLNAQEEKFYEWKKHGVFPLWSYGSKGYADGREKAKGSFLLFLYDYKRRQRLAEEGGIEDYIRARVLWHLYHYERVKDNVSVDVFPGVTYDRKGDEFKKVSFLWRFFRYERDKDEVELDLLFLPLKR